MDIGIFEYCFQRVSLEQNEIPPADNGVSNSTDKPVTFWEDDGPTTRDMEVEKQEAEKALQRWQSSYESIGDVISRKS
ncbi:hypothetical protein [Mesorhizobium sp. GbtcB19]|uniref:hypothetical protein n=1 Tax=Mesorhizobium sp. GbtcB19 TaxID=2824764 RepID=UPI001C2FF052|nr:hypothetical protein [Mesorhizobium sp. GbtcB19]